MTMRSVKVEYFSKYRACWVFLAQKVFLDGEGNIVARDNNPTVHPTHPTSMNYYINQIAEWVNRDGNWYGSLRSRKTYTHDGKYTHLLIQGIRFCPVEYDEEDAKATEAGDRSVTE